MSGAWPRNMQHFYMYMFRFVLATNNINNKNTKQFERDCINFSHLDMLENKENRWYEQGNFLHAVRVMYVM